MKHLLIVGILLASLSAYSQTGCAKDSCTKATLAKISGVVSSDKLVSFTCWEVPVRFVQEKDGKLIVRHPSYADECKWQTTTFTLEQKPKQSVFVMLTVVDGKPQERGWILALTN